MIHTKICKKCKNPFDIATNYDLCPNCRSPKMATAYELYQNQLNQTGGKTKMSEKTTSIDSWDGLLKNYLKANHLKEQEEVFACIGIKVDGKDMELEVQRNEEEESFIFGLNVTNKVFLKNNGISVPKEVIGKKLTIKKVLAMNPSLKKEVESLRISKIE